MIKKHKLKGIAKTRFVYLDGEFLDPKPGQEIWNHSPDGFNWGYNGSGPAQLALSVVKKIKGVHYGYQDFKDTTIAALPMGQDFEIEFEL